MMKLSFNAPHLSITHWDPIEIADFSVITGLNGSGKSHLLKALELGSIGIENIDPNEILLYDYEGFTVTNTNINQANNEKYNRFQSKSQYLSQKLQEKRNQILSLLKIPFGNSESINIGLFSDINTLVYYTTGSEQQIIDYLESSSESPSIAIPQLSFFTELGLTIPTNDISNYLLKLNLTGTAIIFLRNVGFTDEILQWQESEYDDYDNSKYNISDPEPIQHSQMYNHFSPSLLSYLSHYSSFAHQNPALKQTSFLDFYNIVKNTFKQIELSYIENLEPGLRKQMESINKNKSILGHIQADHGFFNIYEIEQAEKQYQISQKQNDYNEFLYSKDGTTIFLTEEKFKQNFGESPVLVLNRVLEEYDCNGYEFKHTELPNQVGIDFYAQNISINLYNKKENYYTNLDALSSGERTLLAIAFSIYKLRRNKIIGKLFLMDEVDAALHPSMSKRLMQVLHKYFHENLGIKIIISTHSPSSVAFAPEESLLIMKRDQHPRLIRVTKDEALQELTEGVPSFSINYENRRQIFVESKYDVEYYEKLYTIFKRRLNSEISLNFIASGDVQKDQNGRPKSSCATVIGIVSLLREAGNNFVWGIVDWDLATDIPQNKFVTVLGFEKRYSIENFLLDPLLVGILLLRERYVESQNLGLSENFKIQDIIQLSETNCQNIINAVSNKLGEGRTEIRERVVYNTVNGLTLTIPIWVANMRGHDLEQLYLNRFRELNEISKNQENLLKSKVIEKVIYEFEDFAPTELLEIFVELQKM